MSSSIDTEAIVKGFQESLVESDNGTATLDDYIVEVLTACPNCGRSFDSPQFILREKDSTATFLVDGDCVVDPD
jgi:hypothetical protein